MRFQKGQKIQHAHDPSRTGIVEGPGPLHAGLQYYRVFWGPTGTQTMAETDIREHMDIRTPTESLKAAMLGSYGDFQRQITLQRLLRDQPLRNNVYAFNASRTRFYPYQFKPLLKFLESAQHRVLICDEVGLGKTIEAGLILVELRARQPLRHVLVVCPSNLRQKWRMELRQRFGEDFQILDSSGLRTFLDDFEEAPDRTELNGIVSIETLRSERVRNRIEELGPAFDLILVDEAHHFRNFDTSQRDVLKTLAEGAQAMVMLTATPIQLGQSNLFSLLNLLDAEDFPDSTTAEARFQDNEHIVSAQVKIEQFPPDLDGAISELELALSSPWVTRKDLLVATQEKVRWLRSLAGTDAEAARKMIVDLRRDLAELNLLGHIVTRTRKREVQDHVAQRHAQSIEVRFSEREQAFYDLTSALIEKESAALRSSVVASWRLNTPQRRMASSLQGMVEYYRGELVAPRAVEERDAESVSDDEADDGEREEDDLRRTLGTLVATWPLNALDAKYERLREVLANLLEADRNRKLLIFATFKHTIRYLERRLKADGFGVVAISGDTPQADRPAAIARFRDDSTISVMLSSRVGSEGLDFQFCSTLVNYDLPWNPMEVEQRIGRLDRIGQEAASIAILNFWVVGTIEERILKRLYDRLGVFRRSIGDLEPILGEITDLIRAQWVQSSRLSAEEQERVAEELAKAIEDHAKQLEKLDSAAGVFVGMDHYFESEVRAIRKQRRYVTGAQLHRFVSEFLRREVPRTRLTYDFATNFGVLHPDEGLKSFLRDENRLADCPSIAAAVGGSLPFTLDSQVAFERPHLEFLNVTHPLIQAIADHYAHADSRAGAQHVALRTSSVSPGFYYFFAYRLRITSARPYNSLEAVIISDDLRTVLTGEVAESILGEMVELGENPRLAVPLSTEQAAQAAAHAEDAFLSRLAQLRESEEQNNEAFVDQRMASVQTYFTKNIQRKRLQLADAKSRNKHAKYIRMQQGQLTKLEAQLASRVRELDNLRRVTGEYDELAAGILEVV